MNIERVFNEESNIKIEEILDAVLVEFIDTFFDEYYNASNHTTSSAEGDVA